MPETHDRTGHPVMVTTQHRGVFAGLLADDQGDVVTITDARMCVRWTQAERGIVGLAQQGPGAGCRVSPAAPRLTLRDVTAVFDLTPAAWDRWQAEPWGD